MAKAAWRLIFVQGLIDNFLSGEEVLDIRVSRPDSNSFKKGQLIEGHFMEGFSLLLEITRDTVIKRLSEIAPIERSGWAKFNDPRMSHSEMLDIMRGYYPALTNDSMIAINAMMLPEINGRPIAGRLPEGIL